MLKRKIDIFLSEWKKSADRKPLIVKGARQVGKTASIHRFAVENYANVVEINFALQKKYKSIFNEGYDVDSVISNISFLNPAFKFEPGSTLIFFDEIQDQPDCATCLKSFKMDGRYDVICSGSLMGLYYQQIESNSVGYKEDYEMRSLDFEEFLWAKGYSDTVVHDMLNRMLTLQPFTTTGMEVLFGLFTDYMVVGGMPEVVNNYITQNNFSGMLKSQTQLLQDYEEDITKYASGFDKAKVLAVYRHIPTFLAKENKRFQITKISTGARNREYVGAVEWLSNAGIVGVCHCLESVELPLKGNYDPKQYKLYFRDTGLLCASLDKESQEDLRSNRNLGVYKGALFENIAADMLVKQDYDLYYYKNEKSTIEMDFFVRDQHSLIPVEIKANDKATASLNKLVQGNYSDIKYGIKFCRKNIGFNGKFYTFPYFLGFLLRRFLREMPKFN